MNSVPKPMTAVDTRSPFVRLTDLLGDVAPGKPPISLAVGEPQHPVPSFVGPILAKNLADFGKYPPNKGSNRFCEAAAAWLTRAHGQPAVRTVPIGTIATRAFIEEVAFLAGVDPAPALDDPAARAPWWSKSVDSTYLTGKRVFVFGDATHAVAGRVTIASGVSNCSRRPS